jgi:U3 small nucleolar ribonucleoprotein protein IMP3
MGRKLKYHEQVLLKKHNFLYSKRDTNLRELHVLRRYGLEDRSDYLKYNRLVGNVHELAYKLKKLAPNDAFRIELTDKMLEKLYAKGLIPSTKSLELCDEVGVASFCRRRLPIVMVRSKMAESVKTATTLIQHGHVRVGPTTVTDPAYFVTRMMEDQLTWVEGSKIKRTVAKYNDKLDDFELLNA